MTKQTVVHKHPDLDAYQKRGLKMHVMPREKWSFDKCHRKARSFHTDGLGTRSNMRGYCHFPYPQVYNGGTVVDGQWYNGILQELPEVPASFEFIYIISWGYQLINRLEQAA